MMKQAILSILVVMVSLFGFSNTLEKGWEMAFFKEAEQLYSSGDYNAALEKYAAIESSGKESKALYYNMGNAYFKLNKVGPSILYYERALRMSPGDEDVLFNLQLAKLRTVDQFEKMPVFFVNKLCLEVSNWFNSTIWAVLFNIIFGLMIAGIALFLFSNSYQNKRGIIVGIVLSFIIAITLLLFAYSKYEIELSNHEGVIFVPNTYVKSSPDENGTDVFMLHEGTKVEVLEDLNGWYRIRVEDGKKGWVIIGAIAII